MDVFEKILERLDSHIEDAKSEGDFSYIKPFEIAKRAVQEVAEDNVCKYRHCISHSKNIYFLTQCGHRHSGYLSDSKSYCPYCGKKIKAVKNE